MRINRRPLTDLVYQLLLLDGHLAPSLPQAAVIELAQSSAVFGTVATQTPRRIVVGLDVRPSSLVSRQDVMRSLQRRLQRDVLEIETDDWPGAVVYAMCSDVRVEYYTGAYANPVVYVELTFQAPDPARIDREPLVLGLSTARTPCPVGEDTVAPRLWLYGGSPAVVDPVVAVRDHTGAEVMRLTLTGSLAEDDALAIDCAWQTVEHYVAGVLQSRGLGWVTSGRFPLLDPRDCSPDASLWGTVELLATSGTPTGLLAYHRRS